MLPKTQADLIASLGLQPTQQDPFAYTPRQPQSTIEPLPLGYRMPSKNPTIRKLQGLGDFAKSLFAVETPLDAVLSGIAPPAKAAKALKPVAEEVKDLMFLHRTKPDALKSFAQMGGIPSPSLAVTKQNMPFTGFGPITLVAKPQSFDPLIDPRNKIYSADAYTPRAPKKLRFAKSDANKKLVSDYENLAKDDPIFKNILNSDRGKEQLDNASNALLNLDKNFNYFPDNRLDELDRFLGSDLAEAKFIKDTGRNLEDFLYGDKSNPQINLGLGSENLWGEFRVWANKEPDRYLQQDGVFSYFDEFDETVKTKPYTLDNVVKQMVAQGQRGGESGLGDYGPNRLQALMSKEFTNLDEVKKSKSRLKKNDFYYDVSTEINDVFESVTGFERPSFSLSIMNNVGAGLEKGEDISTAIDRAIDFEQYTDYELDIPVKQKEKLLAGIKDIFVKNANRSAEYFEAKPMRPVGFDEFAGAIVQENTPKETIDLLKSLGLKIQQYDPFDEGSDILARKAFDKYMFSAAPVAGVAGILSQEE